MLAALTGTVVAVLFVAVATAGSVKFTEGSDFRSPAAPVTTTAPDSVVSTATVESEPWKVPPAIGVGLLVVFLVCVAILFAVLLRYAWRHRPKFRWSRRRRPPRLIDFDVLDEVATAITADAEAQRSALGRGTPRNAIVECWLRLEAAATAAGVPREPADTSTDFMQRVLTTRHIEPTAISALAALYREARFSDHPMTEDSRRAAIDALEVVHEGLRSAMGTTVVTA